MSTTVTYKGSTLTTVNNQTRTLKTAGKYMEGDVILTDVTESGSGGYVTQDQDGFIVLPSTGGGSGGGAQELTGTFTGNGDISVQIPCSFAPNLIYVYGDLSGDVTLRGVISITLIKDTTLYLTADTSQSSTSENLVAIAHGFSGYNESNSSAPHATYSNGVLTIDTGENTSSKRFASGITYNYKLVGLTLPSSDIPLNTQLIDFTKTTNDYVVNSSGNVVAEQWYSVSDYTEIDPSMTFSYSGCYWFYIGFYDASKNTISALNMNSDGTQRSNDTNYCDGTLTPAKIPSNAKYVRITSTYNPDSTILSLIRTA